MPLPRPITASVSSTGPSGPSGPTIARATIPTTIAADPRANVLGAVRERVMKPDIAPPSAKGTEKARKRMPDSSTLTPRTTSSAVGTSTITTPEPQFERVAVAVPRRNATSRVTRSGMSGSRPRTRSHTSSRNPAPTTSPPIVYALSHPPAATCWMAAHPDPIPNMSITRVTTGTARVGSAGRRGTSQSSITNATDSRITFTPKNARHDHASASTGATSGPQAPPIPPSAPQMPTASGCEPSPSNSASMAANDVVKQHADATPCSERPSIITANVSATAHVADATAKPTTPTSSTGRAPTRSATRPMSSNGAANARLAAVTIAPATAGVTPRSWPIVGSSTTTPFMSTDSATTGRLSAHSASHRRVVGLMARLARRARWHGVSGSERRERGRRGA
jgi:hypothetical protein